MQNHLTLLSFYRSQDIILISGTGIIINFLLRITTFKYKYCNIPCQVYTPCFYNVGIVESELGEKLCHFLHLALFRRDDNFRNDCNPELLQV